MDVTPDNETVTKFIINSLKVYAKVSWKENKTDIFSIKIYVGDSCWSGRFSREFGQQFISYTDETEDQYYRNVKISLSGQTNLYTYDFVKSSENDAEFSWKRCYEGSSVLLVHGSVPVHLDADPDPRESLIDHLLTENLGLRQKVTELDKKYNTIAQDYTECKSELEKFVNIKTSLEQTLYGRFVTLLNTKKRRIQLLEENINKITSGNNQLDNEVD